LFQALESGQLRADAVLLPEDALRLLGPIPEIELARLFEQLVDARA
jgi:hypothetical protein